jgi:streptogramin lyase
MNGQTHEVTSFKHEPNNANSIPNNNINIVFVDRDGRTWIGTETGVARYLPHSKSFARYIHQVSDPQSISNDYITCFADGPKGYLWVGTSGLNLLNIKTGKFKRYSETDGFANNAIKSIVIDKKGNLWISSNKGLTRFNYYKNDVRNYSLADGLQSNEFKARASFMTQDGEIYFGGLMALTAFILIASKTIPLCLQYTLLIFRFLIRLSRQDFRILIFQHISMLPKKLS